MAPHVFVSVVAFLAVPLALAVAVVLSRPTNRLWPLRATQSAVDACRRQRRRRPWGPPTPPAQLQEARELQSVHRGTREGRERLRP